jgi:hypothetical protein
VEVLRRWRSRKIPSGRVLRGWQRSLRGHLRSTDRSVGEREGERERGRERELLWSQEPLVWVARINRDRRLSEKNVLASSWLIDHFSG